MTNQATVMDDVWAMADNAKMPDYEYFGQVMAEVWLGYFGGKGQKPVPFDPSQHPADKKTAIIEVQIIPIAEQAVTRDIRQSYTDFSADWIKVTLPSIKALGVDGLRSLIGKYVRVASVPGKRKRIEKDGTDTGEYWQTFKFMELYPSLEACEEAYAGKAAGSFAPADEPEITDNNPEKQAAFEFAKIFIEKAVAVTKDETVIKSIVGPQLAGTPITAKFFTAESPEIVEAIHAAINK